MRGKAWLSLCLCALCLTGAAGAEIALSGTVSAREAVARYGVSVADFDQALEMFNQTNPALAGSE